MSKVNPENLPIRKLLSADSDTRFAVPKYQRNFEWKREQAEELWNDVSVTQVFLGTLVLNTSTVAKDKITTIVDGQQRLTTISILLAACRVRAYALGNGQLANEIQRKLSFVNDTTGSSQNAKIIVSSKIRETYDATIANSEWDGSFDAGQKKRQANKIRPIYAFFADKVSNYNLLDIGSLLENIYGSNFVAIFIDSDEDAFEIFERTNARGLELNAAELLKNYFYKEDVSDGLDNLWDEITAASNGNILRLIKYYYVSKHGYIQKRDLYRSLKDLGSESSPKDLFEDIRDFSDFYYLITAGNETDIKDWAEENDVSFFQTESNQDQLHTSLAAISLFKATQIYPILIALMRHVLVVPDGGQKKYAEELLSFIQTIEKFLFLNYAVSQNPGNQIEVYFADKCKELASNDNKIEFMNVVRKDLRGKKVGEGEFSERFATLSYETDKHLIYYFFDRLNNASRKPTERIKIYNPDQKILRKNYDCDHFVPQNYGKSWPKLESLDEVLHSMGNMLVIARHTNGSMNDLLPELKFDLIHKKQSHLPYIASFISEWKDKNWSNAKEAQSRIRERTKELADHAYNKVWNF